MHFLTKTKHQLNSKTLQLNLLLKVFLKPKNKVRTWKNLNILYNEDRKNTFFIQTTFTKHN